ncbi:MAG: hypothetical protein JXM74_08675 [Fusobacteriaceae bacterium]|nr:hypothetical protein [Fusobacteriaceae bacterium]
MSKLRSLSNNKLNTISSTDVNQPEVEETLNLRKLFNIPDDYTTFFKKGGKSNINIKPENRGKFTEYCGGKVTQECISKGKNSSNPKIRKRATFAANARKWKHQKGGKIKYDISDILDQ